jgi:DNA repair protein RadC
MERPKWHKPSKYQLGFEFGEQRPVTDVFHDGHHRFVRVLREEVKVVSPADVAQHLMRRVFYPFEAFEQEELWACLLNNKHRITHEALIYRGTINTLLIRQAEIFRPAIRYNAAAMILAHNHPGNDPTPSQQDVSFTVETRELGQRLGVELLDHLVICHNRWVSLKERGLAFD